MEPSPTEQPEEEDRSQEGGQPWQDSRANDSNDTLQSSPHDSPQLSPTGNDLETASHTAAPIQKRRRVTRACDECRRKKIKCDGKQPCTHCTVYSYECTYDQPSNRRRTANPQYIETLENQLKRAGSILKLVIPNADLNDPNLEAKLRDGTLSPIQPEVKPIAPTRLNHGGDTYDGDADSQLESMVKSTGQLDLDEQGNLQYHGHSSGLTFVRRMREQLGDVFGPEGRGTPFLKSRPVAHVFDSPRSANDSPFDSGIAADLPSRELALTLCDNAINDAASLLRIVHWPTFKAQFDAVYDKPPEQYSNDENAFLPLLYATMALGTLFAKEEGSELDKKGYENAITEGFKYFKASRQMMDIADCRDLRQLQAICYMILFLQSSAKLSTCYAYIGVALRSALRMGLHRSFPDSNFTPIVSETRKRLFWVVRKMDTYVGALLGLPHSLHDEDIDQELPAEVDDEFITETSILPMPEGRIPVQTAANAHTKLVSILAKIVKYVYPLKRSHPNAQGKLVKSYSVSYAKILEIERDLQEWQDKLPLGLKPGGEAPLIIIRVQHLLRLAYAHAQMMLYRPFLHYVSQTDKSQIVDKRSYACAAACVSVSRNIIHIAVEMKRRKLLVGAYWFTMYTTFFAIISLVFYALENPGNDASRDVLLVAKEGKDTLQSLAKRSMAADRCTATLAALFEQLPERLGRTRKTSVASRKRRQGVSQSPLADQTRSQKIELILKEESKSQQQPRRANTYPDIVMGASRALDFPPAALTSKSLDTNSSNFANSHSFFDATAQSPPGTSGTTPTMTTGVSQHNPFPTSPTNFADASFPLADLSAMMFPSTDPFAYPNQPVAPAQSYDELLKNLGDDPSFPYSASLEALRLQRSLDGTPSEFMPPSSTFMLGAPNFKTDDVPNAENDVPLLGPMPPYAMQGCNQQGEPITGGTAHINGRLFNQPQQPQQQRQQPQVQANFSVLPNMNLNDLLGGEEWAGGVEGALGSFTGPLPETASSFTNQLQQNPGTAATSAAVDEDVKFNDMSPGTVGWGLEGY